MEVLLTMAEGLLGIGVILVKRRGGMGGGFGGFLGWFAEGGYSEWR
jgi:hypothetical protein